MDRYLETSEELRQKVNLFLSENPSADPAQLGILLNLAVRCNPRQPCGVVRKNIIETAMRDHCTVSMTKEISDSGYEFNLIYIEAK